MHYFIKVLTLAFIFFTTISHSADLIDTLKACQKISENSKRLMCYDALKFSTKNLDNSTPDNTLINSKVSVQQQKEDAFGKEHLKKTTEEEENKTIELTINSLKKMIRGEWTITFNNGQRWRQVDSTKLKLKVGDIVELKKGFFNTISLHKKNSNKNIKIKRIK